MDAFADLVPVTDRYATLPVGEAFTWAPVAKALDFGEWYMVAFRSIQKADANKERLTQYDDWAHEEAAGAPGFVHYFKGPLASDRSCLSFCLWNSRAEARAAAARPAHRDAVTLIAEAYDAYALEFLTVRKRAGSAALEFEPYDFAAEAGAVQTSRPATLGFSPAPT
jgi:hypothetical protein